MSLRRLTLVILVVFITTEAASGEEVKKAVGDAVCFRPNRIDPPASSIMWKHRNSSGVLVNVIEWDCNGFSIPNQRFKDITTLDKETGEITIRDLNVKHSGLYTININSKEQEQRFHLEVLERVPKPVIKTQKSINPDAVYLICEYSETIIWKNSAGKTLKGLKLHLKGEFITVEKQGNPENFYTCTLENAVSEATSDPVYERDLFNDLNTRLVVAIAVSLITVVIIILFLIKIHFRDYCAACCRRSKIYKKITDM
uniref:Si:ch211-132g1.3 n=1 Tax=Cyprinus carpio TaxID=7962 RepID=A0A8C1QDG8_CYPCA